MPTPAVPSARRSTEITVRELVAATPLVVSVFPAQRRFAVDDSSAITIVSLPGRAAASACSTVSCGVLAGDLASFALTYFPSSTVLSTRTCRNSAAGAPWLTGATWPGWPLPQLKAPPST